LRPDEFLLPGRKRKKSGQKYQFATLNFGFDKEKSGNPPGGRRVAHQRGAAGQVDGGSRRDRGKGPGPCEESGRSPFAEPVRIACLGGEGRVPIANGVIISKPHAVTGKLAITKYASRLT